MLPARPASAASSCRASVRWAGGPRAKTEDHPHGDTPALRWRRPVAARRWSRRSGGPGGEGVVLRYGFFYGPGPYYGEDGTTTAEVRRRRMPSSARAPACFVHPCGGRGRRPVAAVERGGPGVDNVTDDEPAPMSEWLPVFAEAAGAKRTLRVRAVARAPRVRPRGADLRARASRRVQREGEARARLGAGSLELPRRLPRASGSAEIDDLPSDRASEQELERARDGAAA